MGFLAGIDKMGFMKGFAFGFITQQIANAEHSAKQGKNYILSLGPQIGQNALANIQTAEGLALLLPSHAGRISLISWIAGIALQGTTILASIYRTQMSDPNDRTGKNKVSAYGPFANWYNNLKNNFLPFIPSLDPNLKSTSRTARVYVFISEHVGDVAQVVAVAATVFKLILGQKTEAITGLVLMGIGVLDRKGYLPNKVSVFFNKHVNTLAQVFGVIVGSPFEKLICTINLIIIITPPLFDRLRNPIDAWFVKGRQQVGIHYPLLRDTEMSVAATKVATQAKFTVQEIIDFDERTPLKMDPAHVKRLPALDQSLAATPIHVLGRQFAAIDWNNRRLFKLLENKVTQDSRWIDEQKANANPLQPTDPNWQKAIIGWAQQQLATFCDHINLNKRPQGDLSTFSQVQNDARIIAGFMEREKDNADYDAFRLDLLIKFAVEGGDYCVNGIRRVVSEAKNAVLLDVGSNITDIVGRVDANLSEERRRLNETFYYDIFSQAERAMPVYKGFDKQDIHMYNTFLRMYCWGLGIDMTHAKNDNLVQLVPVIESIGPVFMPMFRSAFWGMSDTEKHSAYFEGLLQKLSRYATPMQGTGGILSAIIAKVKTVFQMAQLPLILGQIWYNAYFQGIHQVYKANYRIANILGDVLRLFGTSISAQEYQDWWRAHLQKIGASQDEQQNILIDLMDPDHLDIRRNPLPKIKYLKIFMIENGYSLKPNLAAPVTGWDEDEVVTLIKDGSRTFDKARAFIHSGELHTPEKIQALRDAGYAIGFDPSYDSRHFRYGAVV